VVQENNIYADVAYVIPVSDNSKLSLGVKAGITLFDVNFNGFVYSDPTMDNSLSIRAVQCPM
jgi:hypothetical protein